MSSSVISEFLVSLGFTIDEAGFRRFRETLGNVAKTFAAVGAAVVAATTAVIAGVSKIAATYEQLYYLSQRAGTSVAQILALKYAFNQIGLAGSAAEQALSSFAMALRLNPGNEGLLNSLGVVTRDANGKILETQQLFLNFVGKLKDMPFYVAAQYAQMYGITAEQLLQLEQNYDKLRAKEAEYRDLVKRSGLQMDEIAKNSVEWQNALGRIGAVLNLLLLGVYDRLERFLLPKLKDFTQYLLDHFPQIVDRVAAVAKAFVRFTGYFIDGASQIIEWAKDLKHWFEGMPTWFQWVAGVTAGIGLLVAAFAIAPITAFAVALAGIVAAVGALADNWAAVKRIFTDAFTYIDEHLHALEAWLRQSWLGRFIDKHAVQSTPEQKRNELDLPFAPDADPDDPMLRAPGFRAGPHRSAYTGEAVTGGGFQRASYSTEDRSERRQAQRTGTRVVESVGRLAVTFDRYLALQNARWFQSGVPAALRGVVAAPWDAKGTILDKGALGGGGGGGSGGGGGGGGLDAPPGAGPAPPPARLDAANLRRIAGIRDRLTSVLGISREAAAGVLSNFWFESHISGIQRPGGRDFGWAQWVGSRRDAFDAYVAQHRLDPRSDQANFGFFVEELTRKYPQVLRALRGVGGGAGAARRAAELFFHLYESGGSPALERYLGGHTANADQFAGLGSGAPPLGADRPVDGSAKRDLKVHNETHVRVDGARDPRAVAEQVALRQRRVHADLVRDFTGAVIW